MIQGELEELAARALLDIAGDRTARASMRIAAARTVYYGRECEVTDPSEPSEQASEVNDDVIDHIAERVAERLRETGGEHGR